ncbi:PREDICTED: zinc finger BED domain-containing protein RICESLEEPER 1-like [Nelumbo nucifera]|uniref:Zinc finger BED domain-containing protein RICESLEEPER 1-like n=1 Tax=Nelumbo nucifera TaxID=4432 RepID=A0A1U7Z2C1_NELNU|nr:PREDICTED: zinc finger BED domain-containing protein RICESLEEPER 1-like [Nelumbo nucifera]
MAEHEFLEIWATGLIPMFKMVSHNTIRNYCMKIYGDEKVKLYGILDRLDSLIRNKKELVLDCPKIWNTTYDMLKTAPEYRVAFARLEQIDEEYNLNPSSEEWDIGQIDEWLLSKYDYVQVMAGKMWGKFKKYWDGVNLPLAVVVVLDPRYKLAFVRYNLHRVYGYVGEDEVAKVRECLYNLYSHYANYDTSSIPNEESSPLESCITSSASGVMQESKKKYLKGFQKWCTSDETTTSVFYNKKSELDQYLEKSLIPENAKF